MQINNTFDLKKIINNVKNEKNAYLEKTLQIKSKYSVAQQTIINNAILQIQDYLNDATLNEESLKHISNGLRDADVEIDDVASLLKTLVFMVKHSNSIYGSSKYFTWFGYNKITDTITKFIEQKQTNLLIPPHIDAFILKEEVKEVIHRIVADSFMTKFNRTSNTIKANAILQQIERQRVTAQSYFNIATSRLWYAPIHNRYINNEVKNV